MNKEDVLGAIARGWCSEKNEKKTMDSDLALAIGKEVMLELDKMVESEDVLFERIWEAIKHWDIDTSGTGREYHGLNGTDVRAIISAISGTEQAGIEMSTT